MKEPTVVHVLPLDESRGAQMYARALRSALDGAAGRHRTVTLFRSSGGVLQPDYALDVEPARLRRVGADPRAAWRLRRLVRAEAVSVVVAHGSEPLKYAVLAGVARANLVAYKIGAGHARLTGGRRQVYRSLLARAGMVAAVSDAAAAEAVSYGVPAARLRVIRNARDPQAYPPHGRAPGAVRLVWVGHLDAAKRPLRFVELVRELRQRGVDVAATIAGDGPLLDEVRSASRDANVAVLGNVDDVPALLAASDVLVLTSAPNEGMPGVLIEAGMAGLAVVTTDVPGATDVVVDGSTGFVVPIDDLDALVRATRALVDDAGRRDRFGAAAHDRCEREFSLAASVRAWQALLAEMTPQDEALWAPRARSRAVC